MGTMIVISEASALVGIAYLLNKFVTKRPIAWHVYLMAFLFICGTLFTFSANAYTCQYEYDVLSDAEKKMCADNMLKCERMAKYHYNLAKDKTWWLPDLSNREKGRYCYTSFVAGIFPSTPQSKIVAMISVALTQYGLDCISEWNYINEHMMQSQAWWESYEFYKENLESNR
jgi:hypothetical protein